MINTPFLIVDNVSVGYGQTLVASNISFSLNAGELAGLLGPSGCGKTTILRAIAGFEPLRSGSFGLDGQVLSCRDYSLPPEQRNIGMMFQDFALFPHLNVRDNIGFGLQKLPRKSRQKRVSELLELMQLPDLAKRYPHKLSGGQQQRIALARALAPKPRLLLMDEPFSSLDTDLRESLASEVRTILKSEKITGILVTHDPQEARKFADKLGVMKHGKLAHWDDCHA